MSFLCFQICQATHINTIIKLGPLKGCLAACTLSLMPRHKSQWIPILRQQAMLKGQPKKGWSVSSRAVDDKKNRIFYNVSCPSSQKCWASSEEPVEDLEFWNTFTFPNPAKNQVGLKISKTIQVVLLEEWREEPPRQLQMSDSMLATCVELMIRKTSSHSLKACSEKGRLKRDKGSIQAITSAVRLATNKGRSCSCHCKVSSIPSASDRYPWAKSSGLPEY